MEFEKLQGIIAEVLHKNNTQIYGDSSFDQDLGADSLEVFQIILKVEEVFDITIDEKMVYQFKTVDDLFRYISSVRV